MYSCIIQYYRLVKTNTKLLPLKLKQNNIKCKAERIIINTCLPAFEDLAHFLIHLKCNT